MTPFPVHPFLPSFLPSFLSFFSAFLPSPAQVKAYFSGLDIDPDETKIIFTLLDSDCNGDIDIEDTDSSFRKVSMAGSQPSR